MGSAGTTTAERAAGRPVLLSPREVHHARRGDTFTTKASSHMPRANNPPPPAVATLRARHAHHSRYRGADDPVTRDAARDLRAEQLAEHVRRKLAEAPPLTESQRARIVALLRAPADDGADAPGAG